MSDLVTRVLLTVGQFWNRAVEARWFGFGLFLVMAAVYLPFASWGTHFSVDVRTNQYTAWKLGTGGTFSIPEFRYVATAENMGVVTWLVDTGDDVVSRYPPGAALAAAPLYALTSGEWTARLVAFDANANGPATVAELPMVPDWPAVTTASLAVAGGVTGLFLGLSRLGITRSEALASSLVAGLGTGAFSVGSDALWQHGVAVGFLGGFLALVARHRHLLAGIMAGGAILTRPTTAFVVVGVAGFIGLAQRSWRKTLALGIPSVLAMGLFVFHQYHFFGSITRTQYVSAALDVGSSALVSDLIGLLRSLVDVDRGLLVLSPVVAVGLVYSGKAWAQAPAWVRGAAIGGALMFLFQVRGGWSGGAAFFGYRYLLEPLWAASPLLALGGLEAWRRGGSARRALAYTAALSIVVHAFGAASPHTIR